MLVSNDFIVLQINDDDYDDDDDDETYTIK